MCTLPRGIGLRNAVVVIATIKNTVRPSELYPLVSYGPPVVTAMRGCSNTGALVTALTGCVRNGGQSITIFGRNFGELNAQISLGATQCRNVTHNSTDDTVLLCTLPPGALPLVPLQVLQENGQASLSVATVGYEPCPPGTFQNGSEITCVPCAPGEFSRTAGRTSCELCAAGICVRIGEYSTVCRDISCCSCRCRFILKHFAIPAVCSLRERTVSDTNRSDYLLSVSTREVYESKYPQRCRVPAMCVRAICIR